MPTGLLEREAELERVQELIEHAREGDGAVLVVEGPAGIGKSALLRSAGELAEAGGMGVLRARGAELEQQYAFGVAVQLADPVLAGASRKRRDQVFDGAAAFVLPLFEPDAGDELPVRNPGFRTLHGLYWLIANLVQEKPLLLAVDDAHWSDEASLRFLAFLAGRLEGLPLLLVAAMRPGEGAEAGPLEALLGDSAVTVLRPPPLSAVAVGELIGRNLSQEPDDAFVAACHEATGGNPFLAGELLLELAHDGVAPTAAYAGQLEDVGSAAVARSVLARVARLGPDAEALARACAVLGDGATLGRAAALADLDQAAAGRAADALAGAAILQPGALLAFVHPIVRAAVHGDSPPHERAAAHASAARLLTGEGAPAEHVAAHLLLADAAGDADVATCLAEAAHGALARGAPGAAVAYLRRALAEPPDPSERSALLHELGVAETAIGDPGATEHLREALEPEVGAEREAPARALAAALGASDRFADAVELLAAEIDRLGPEEQELAMRLEAELVPAALLGGIDARIIDERLAHYPDWLPGETPGERMLLAVSAYHRMLTGRSADEATDLVRRALAGGAIVADQTADSPLLVTAVVTLIGGDHSQEVEQAIDWVMRDARVRGSVAGETAAVGLQTQFDLVRGRVRDGEAGGVAALEHTLAAGLVAYVPWIVGLLVVILTQRGDLDAAEGLLERYGIAGELPPRFFFDIVLCARAGLHLARGRPAEALADAEVVARRHEACGLKLYPGGLTDWTTSAARAHLALGDRDRALQLAEQRLAIARDWGRPRSLGVALRTRALAEDDAATAVEGLREAVAVLARSEAELEHAWALVDLGAALRRLKRPSEAREPLREALELAERLGAKLAADRARDELEATGERRRKTQWLAGVESLTPSERRVAGMATEGLSNKEIAQALFVTLKTVEVHLTQTYRKLGISSRKELPAALSQD